MQLCVGWRCDLISIKIVRKSGELDAEVHKYSAGAYPGNAEPAVQHGGARVHRKGRLYQD